MARRYLSGPWERLGAGIPALDPLFARSEAGLLRGFWAACSRMSPQRASDMGGAMLRRLGPRSRQHRKLLRNLTTAFPSWNANRLATVATANWENLGRVLAEYPHLSRIAGEHDWRRFVDVDCRFDLAGASAGTRPLVLVSAHLGNWELAGAMAARLGVPMTVVYSSQQNSAIDAALQRWRSALDCRLIEKDVKVHALLAEIKAGRSLGILMDQRYDVGDSVSFFGHDAPVPLAPATLAARLNLPFVPVRLIRLGSCRFRLEVEPAIEPDRTLAEPREVARDMTSRLYRRFESWITEHPDQWLCTKRRWPDLRKGKWRAKLASNPRLVRDPGAVSRP